LFPLQPGGSFNTRPSRRERRFGRKLAMALREHGLGLCAGQTHQLVFAILASESEPVDPRL
jgi:hypothetical protein